MPVVKPLLELQFMLQSQIGNKKGISIIEILIVIAIIAIALTSFLGLVSFSLSTLTLIKQTTQANYLAQELMEAVRNFRDGTDWQIDGLGALTIGADYYFQKIGSPAEWQPILGEESIAGFTRKIIFEQVARDENDDIISSGGTNDPDTKKTSIRVSWQERGRSHQLELVIYLTNWH